MLIVIADQLSFYFKSLDINLEGLEICSFLLMINYILKPK